MKLNKGNNVYITPILALVTFALFSCSQEAPFECEGDIKNTSKMIGKSLDDIKNFCGSFDAQKDLGSYTIYAYKMDEEGKHDKKILQFYHVLDTVRAAYTIYRYSGESLEDGENLKEYKPAVEKYSSLKSKVAKRNKANKVSKDSSSGKEEDYLLKEEWVEGKGVNRGNFEGRMEIRLKRKVYVSTEFDPEKGSNVVDDMWTDTSIHIVDGAY